MADLENLREQAENLEACLARLRRSADAFPNPKEAIWLETLMESSLLALRTHIAELEKLEYRSPQRNTMFVRRD